MRILIRSQANSKWAVVDSLTYQNEAELQQLLADDPTLIPVADIRQDVQPLCVGVSEVSVPGSGFIDILAFSPAGDVGIIECKLASNAEIKRKVVGQLLEYGAFVWQMSYDELDAQVRARTQRGLAELVRERVAAGFEEQEFREAVAERLRNGDLLLIIVVDEITDELSRTIEFLNECGGGRFSFHALEMQRFGAHGTEILVPHLHGVQLSSERAASPRQRWDETRFFEALKSNRPELVTAIRDLYQWAQTKAAGIQFGSGLKAGSFAVYFHNGERAVSMFWVDTNGVLWPYMAGWKLFPGNFAEQLRARLVQIP